MIIRTGNIKDLEDISNIENECFPATEAATKEEFKERLKYYANHFLLLFEEDKLIAFIDGFVTDEKDLTDDMYKFANLHNENGKWQMIFGLNTLPKYRQNGYAGQLVKSMIKSAKEQNRLGVVLTCKKALVNYYSKFGFINEGITDKSTHGGVEWYQMRLMFD